MSNKENTFGIFEEVWKTVSEHFFDPNFNGVDWNALRWVYAPKIKQAVSKNVAFSIINQMLAELKCSHTRLYNQSESAYYELVDIFGPQQLKEEITRKVPDQQFEYRPMGFYTKELNGETFISGILAGSPAANAGLTVGEKVVAVNGNSFFEPAVLAAQMNEAVKLCIERNRDPGVTMNVTLVPQPLDPGSFFLNAIRESIELIPRGNLRIGYIRVWSFAGDQYYRLLTDALTCGDLKDADGLVMDLRGGWGGADPSYLNIFTERTLTFTQVPRYGPAVSVAFQWSKPVVMLVDEETRSGKEILAYGFKAYRIGKVIGTRTAGAVLMGKPFLLQDGSLLLLAVADVLVNGERLEGKSVVPDIEVPRRLAYAEGRDNQLDTAIEALIAELHRNCSVSPTPSSVPANHRTTAH